MNRTIKWLSIALAVQLVLALGAWLLYRGGGAAGGPLLALQTDQVERITIEGPEGTQAVLVKEAQQWTLPGQGGLPADASRVVQLLDRLAALGGGAPVARSASARERFKVQDRDFERRLTLVDGKGRERVLLVGSSPGLRLAHVRVGGQDDIHAVQLASTDLPAADSDWLDRRLLAIAADDVAQVEVAGLVLDRGPPALADPVQLGAPAPGRWKAQALPAGASLRAGAVDALLRQVAELVVAESLGKEEKPEYGLAAPAAVLTLVRQNGMRVELKLGHSPDRSRFIVKSSVRPEYFRVDSGFATPLLDAARREALVEAGAGKR